MIDAVTQYSVWNISLLTDEDTGRKRRICLTLRKAVEFQWKKINTSQIPFEKPIIAKMNKRCSV